MEYKKVREDINECCPKCPMYYPIAALNNFIKSKGELKCPKNFCQAVINSIDENGKLICSVTGKKSEKMEGYFDNRGKFIRYDSIIQDANVLEAQDDILLDEIEKELENNITSDSEEVFDGNSQDDIIELIKIKLKSIEDYFEKKLEDASYFFTQCREIDIDEKVVCFFNTKNNLIDYKVLEKLSKKERESKILRAHEYRISFSEMISINTDELKCRLDIFFKSLYKSLQEVEQMSCNDCRWEKQMVKGRAMDCLNCLRNEKSRVPKDRRIDNYS